MDYRRFRLHNRPAPEGPDQILLVLNIVLVVLLTAGGGALLMLATMLWGG